MDMKKILALTIVAIALFSTMNAASAGLFDFLGGGEPANQTYTIDGFTLDFPEGTNITNYTFPSESDSYDDMYTVVCPNGDSVRVDVLYGSEIVPTIEDYLYNWENIGGTPEGTYGNWTIIKEPVDNGTSFEYELVQKVGDRYYAITGEDLDMVKSIADTYKKI